MGSLKLISNFTIFTILFASLIVFSVHIDSGFAEDESEIQKLEQEREQAKKEKEKLEEEQKKVTEQEKEDRKQLEKRIKESLKIDFDGFQSGRFADWILVGTVILISGVVGSTGYKIMRPKKRKIVSEN